MRQTARDRLPPAWRAGAPGRRRRHRSRRVDCDDHARRKPQRRATTARALRRNRCLTSMPNLRYTQITRATDRDRSCHAPAAVMKSLADPRPWPEAGMIAVQAAGALPTPQRPPGRSSRKRKAAGREGTLTAHRRGSAPCIRTALGRRWMSEIGKRGGAARTAAKVLPLAPTGEKVAVRAKTRSVSRRTSRSCARLSATRLVFAYLPRSPAAGECQALAAIFTKGRKSVFA